MTWRPQASSDRICEWFTVPLSQQIHERGTQSCNQWLQVLYACDAKRTCEGYEESYWSRVVEDHGQMWIWTLWTTKRSYEKYKETEIYPTFRDRLTSLSPTRPTERILELCGAGGYSKRCLHTGGWPSITLAYFNAPIPEDQHTPIQAVRSLSPQWSEGLSSSSNPPKLGGSRGFLKWATDEDSVALTSGEKAEVFVIIDWWRNPDCEEKVRKETARANSESVSLESLQAMQLRHVGCVEKIVYHARFNRIIDVKEGDENLSGWSLEYST